MSIKEGIITACAAYERETARKLRVVTIDTVEYTIFCSEVFSWAHESMAHAQGYVVYRGVLVRRVSQP